MASRGLGTLTLDLVARIGGFEQGMDKAARIADKRMREIEKRAKQFGAVIATGLVAAGTGLAVVLGKSIDKMDELRDASIRLGIGVETLSAFSFAAQQTGTDIEALGQGFKILAKNMADALNPKSGKAQIFESIGIEVEDATGKLKSFEQIIPEIADKFKQLEDGTTKAALAQELFGKNGLALTEFLNQGGEGIKELTDRARELGIVIDQETADKADQFKDTLGELKAAGEGLATQVASELLPRLLDLAEWARDFVTDGTNAKKVADEIASSFDVLTTAAGVAWKVLQTLGAVTRGVTSDMIALSLSLAAVGKARTFQFGDAQDLMKQAQLARQMASEQSAAIEKIWTAAEGPKKSGMFSGVKGTFRQAEDGIDRNALNRALGGVKDAPAKKKRSGKSDEEKEADRLKAAYDSLNSSLEERIALFGKEGEAAKVRYDIEHGELAKLAPALQQELLAKAESLDLMKAEEDQMRKSADLAKKEAEEKLRGVEATAQMIDDMRFEIDLLGMTNKQRERAIALRYADANATDEQRAQIAKLSDAYYEAKEVADFWLEAQHGIADALYDTVTGAESALDAVKGFFDNLAKYILRSISENWAERITHLFMGASGSTSTSFMNPITGATESSGGGFDWSSLIGAFFGGGRAIGGPVSAGMFYRVNENGPELLSVGGSDYLMMGRDSGNVTPHFGGARGGNNNTTNIFVQGNATRETIKQIDRANGRRTRREMTRTS